MLNCSSDHQSSNLFLKLLIDGAFTTCWERLFQSLITTCWGRLFQSLITTCWGRLFQSLITTCWGRLFQSLITTCWGRLFQSLITLWENEFLLAKRDACFLKILRLWPLLFLNYLIGENFVGGNFRRLKCFVGWNVSSVEMFRRLKCFVGGNVSSVEMFRRWKCFVGGNVSSVEMFRRWKCFSLVVNFWSLFTGVSLTDDFGSFFYAWG